MAFVHGGYTGHGAIRAYGGPDQFFTAKTARRKGPIATLNLSKMLVFPTISATASLGGKLGWDLLLPGVFHRCPQYLGVELSTAERKHCRYFVYSQFFGDHGHCEYSRYSIFLYILYSEDQYCGYSSISGIDTCCGGSLDFKNFRVLHCEYLPYSQYQYFDRWYCKYCEYSQY